VNVLIIIHLKYYRAHILRISYSKRRLGIHNRGNIDISIFQITSQQHISAFITTELFSYDDIAEVDLYYKKKGSSERVDYHSFKVYTN